MKTLLHAVDNKQFGDSYTSAFSSARCILAAKLTSEVVFIRDCQKYGQEISLSYLMSIADLITTYNELSPIRFFYKTKDF